MKRILKAMATLMLMMVFAASCTKPENSDRVVPKGAISGLFSINEHTQVYFSQGNLQYQASTDIWKFAENQWDFVGGVVLEPQYESGNVYEQGRKCDNTLISENYDGWIDLFGWGTSGWNNGNRYYHAYDYDVFGHYGDMPSSSYDASVGYGFGPTDGASYEYDLRGDYANADWGVNNAISNGENCGWYTLTINEWKYLFESRNTSSGIRYVKGKVNEVNGVILLPDDWDSSFKFINANDRNGRYESNKISVSKWKSLEKHGAVFLPAAGYRFDGSWLSGSGAYGYYWTSSSSTFGSAMKIYFLDANLHTELAGNRYNGLSVRLVCPAE